MRSSRSVLVVSPDPWWARMACALAEHAGHRTTTSADEPGRVLRLTRRERPDVVLILVDAEGCIELAAALAGRRRPDGSAVVIATRDVPTLAQRCEVPAAGPLAGVEIVDAWSDPASIVAAVERAAGERLRAVSPEGPGAAVANLPF